MNKARLEAFSDGVIAIIITIMVLELKVPHGDSISALSPLLPVFISYILSFVFIGIYWNNHHHLLQIANKINGPILWANIHLLFWLSLVPFATAWMGENEFSNLPVALYGIVLLMSGIAYFILTVRLVAHHGKDSKIAKAIGKDIKGKISLGIYLTAIPFAFYNSWISFAAYIFVAIIWLMPEQRIERVLNPDIK